MIFKVNAVGAVLALAYDMPHCLQDLYSVTFQCYAAHSLQPVRQVTILTDFPSVTFPMNLQAICNPSPEDFIPIPALTRDDA